MNTSTSFKDKGFACGPLKRLGEKGKALHIVELLYNVNKLVDL